MARIARVVVPNIPHHITQRGVRSMDIFFKDEDYQEYKKILEEQSKKYNLSIVAYTLMTNHVHLIVIPKNRDSFKAIGETHRLYTRKINFEQKVRGHLFQERFFSTPLGESHFFSALRYVEQNPLKAGMVKTIYEYPYSSSQKRLGIVKADPLLSDYKPIDTIENYSEFLTADDKQIQDVIDKTKTGRPCGDLEFYSRIKNLTGREDLLPKKVGRPKIEKN